MNFADSMFGWIAIGVAASLAGMMWPFRRGASGVIQNFVAGVGGAIAGALLSFAILTDSHDAPARLAFAAVGALGALGAMHVLWARRSHGRAA